jgi:hypothetical protein
MKDEYAAGFGCLTLVIWFASLGLQAWSGWTGCQTAGDYFLSQRNGTPTSVSPIIKGVCVFTPGIGAVAGISTKYVFDIPNSEARDVPTPYQIKHGI